MSIQLEYITNEPSISFGECDISFKSGSDLKSAVLISLLSWRRAEKADEVYSDLKWGWWADDVDHKIGSRLWTLQRRKLLPNLLSQVDDYIKQALRWLVDDKVCEQIVVNSTLADIDKIKSTVLIVRGDKLDKLEFTNLWSILQSGV